MMADDKVKTAVETVARRIVADSALAGLVHTPLIHDMTDADWQAVCAAVEAVAKWGPDDESFEAACEYLTSRKPELVKVPVCILCRRERTLNDAYDYNPIQQLTGQPLGWYSGDDGEMCPECMAQTLRGTS